MKMKISRVLKKFSGKKRSIGHESEGQMGSPKRMERCNWVRRPPDVRRKSGQIIGGHLFTHRSEINFKIGQVYLT